MKLPSVSVTRQRVQLPQPQRPAPSLTHNPRRRSAALSPAQDWWLAGWLQCRRRGIMQQTEWGWTQLCHQSSLYWPLLFLSETLCLKRDTRISFCLVGLSEWCSLKTHEEKEEHPGIQCQYTISCHLSLWWLLIFHPVQCTHPHW